jgi:hypothetical protein
MQIGVIRGKKNHINHTNQSSDKRVKQNAYMRVAFINCLNQNFIKTFIIIRI